MPYRSSPTLPADPDVKIFLTGQLILKPDDNGSQCDVGINRCASNHEFTMEIKQKMIDAEQPDVILWRHIGPLRAGGIQIDQEPSSIDGVRKFVPTQDFSRDDHHDDQDFRWIIDLESEEFHNGKIIYDEKGIEPKVLIRDGIFFTATRTDPAKVTVVRTTETDQKGVPMYSIASLIGVNIYLRGEQKFKLAWFVTDGNPLPLILDKPTRASGIKCYEIWINNNPVDPDPSAAPHGELREYYKVVDKVTVHDNHTGEDTQTENFIHYELRFTPTEESEPDPVPPSFGTPTIPCMPVGSGG